MPPAGGGREDCWSDGGTACLVDAWGDRYVEVNRGNLRQKDWSDVADAVNRRQELLGRPRRTDVQCKNRIDTVKKKYKLEKSKPGASQWPLFAKLDSLVAAAPPPPPSSSASAVKKPLPMLSFTVKPRNPNPNPSPSHNLRGFSGGSSSRFRSQTSSESSLGENEEEELDDDDNDVLGANPMRERFFVGGIGREKRKWEGLVGSERGRERGGGGGCGAVGQLVRAIVNFAEVYERVESAKQQQVMELERHRMEFAKDLEFQRMKMFMEAQLEIQKMKRPKYSSGSGKRL